MKNIIFEDGELKIKTKDGYLRIKASIDSDNPGVYIDLYSDKLAYDNRIEENIIPLALVEQTEEGKYCTVVWDSDKKGYSNSNSHSIKFKS